MYREVLYGTLEGLLMVAAMAFVSLVIVIAWEIVLRAWGSRDKKP